METKKHTSLDDILFENKNKAYGAYYNRVTSGFDLMKSLFITIFGIGIIALILSFTVNEEPPVKTPHEVIADMDPTVGLPPKEKDKPVEKDKPATKARVVTDNKTDTPPTPVKVTDNQTEMRDHTEISTVVSGDTPSEGDGNSSIKTPENGNGTGNTDVLDSGTGGGVEQPENIVFAPRDVEEMAVFPGCEKFSGNNEKLQSCLSEQLQKELGNQLMDFQDVAHRQNINEAKAKLQFIIDRSGKIVEVKTLSGGNVELSKEAKEALERISKRMIQKGKLIKPAKFGDGTPVNLMFAIPVKFISN